MRRPATAPNLGEQTFARGLDPGGGTRLGFRQFHQALDAGLGGAHIEVIAHHVQEGLLTHKFPRTVNGMAVSPRRVLLRDESHRAGEVAGGLRVAGLVAGPHHDADFANIRGEGLFNQDVQNGFFHSVLDESLERKRPLIPSRCCDDRLSDPHVLMLLFKTGDVARPLLAVDGTGRSAVLPRAVCIGIITDDEGGHGQESGHRLIGSLRHWASE